MADQVDYSIANSEQIETDLGRRIEQIRLAHNITQTSLAVQSGVSLRTIRRLEKGEGISLDTFIRVIVALGIHPNLQSLLPDPSIRPIDRVNLAGRERQRASSKKSITENTPWVWGDESDNNNE